MKKQKTTMTVTGLNMTVEKQQQVGQAVWLRLIQLLNGELDGVTITFKEES